MIENIDFFYKNPGQYEEVRCLTCNSVCDVERNRSGPSWDTFMLKLGGIIPHNPKDGDKHDRFICPHATAKWHAEATMLRKDIAMSKSPSLQEIMQKDLQHMVDANMGDASIHFQG